MGSLMLQDLENSILSTLQQSELVNFGSAPNWSSTTNPEFSKAEVDYRINQAYRKVMRDISAIDVALWETSVSSTANTYQYALPPTVTGGSPNPPLAELRRVFYKAAGFPFTLEHEPSIRMLPWKEFQRYTAGGYLQPASFGPYPEICSVTPDRKFLQFYPGSANNGDTISIWYSAVPTAGTLLPLLVNETDTIYFPDDFGDLMELYALFKLWPKARAIQAAEESLKLYNAEVATRIAEWKNRSGPDKMRFTDVMVDRATSGPWGWT